MSSNVWHDGLWTFRISMVILVTLVSLVTAPLSSAFQSPVPAGVRGTDELASKPEPANPHLVQAWKEMETGDYDHARKSIELALHENPKSVDAHLMLAELEKRAGNDSAAVEQFRLATTIQSKSFPAHYGLALALLHEGNSSEGETELRTAIALNPRNADAHYNLGVLLLDQGKAQVALGQLHAARKWGPNRPDLAFNLTRAALKCNQVNIAKEEAELSAKAFGSDPAWRLAMGTLFLSSGMPADAIDQLAAALRLDPGNSEIRLQLCRAYLSANQPNAVLSIINEPSTAEEFYLVATALYLLGRITEAKEASSRSLDLSPRGPTYLLLRARIYQRSGQQEAALQLLERAAVLAPDLADVFYSQAVSYYFLANYSAVRSALDHALTILPNSPQFLFLYAISFENENLGPEAVEYLRRAIALDPANARFEFHLGATFLRQNQPEEARQAFIKAIALKPDYAFPHYALGKMLAQEKDFSAAEKELEAAARYQPDLAAALYQLSRVYSAQGKKDLASSTLARFKALQHQETEDDAVSRDEVAGQLR